MSRLSKLLLAAAALAGALLLAGRSSGQEMAAHARGVSAPTAYAVGDVDAINAYNGNLTLRLDAGPRFAIGPSLSLSFGLTFNSNTWESEPRHCFGGDPVAQHDYAWVFPDPKANAGLGWYGGLSKLYGPGAPETPGSSGWILLLPDGSSHTLLPTLREGHPAAGTQPNTLFTRGSYLRMKQEDGNSAACGDQPAGVPLSACQVVEHPDGIQQVFWPFPVPGAVSDWRLTETRDRFGNNYKVEYLASSWRITDIHGRVYTVNFSGGKISSFVLPKFGGGTATWTLQHRGATLARQGYAPPGVCSNAGESPTVAVELLEKLILPDGSFYQISYYEASTDKLIGAAKELRLATGGRYRYTYDNVPMPLYPLPEFPQPGGGPYATIAYAVTKKEVFDSATATTPQGTWSYRYKAAGNPSFESLSSVPCFHTTIITDPAGNDSVHYFSNKFVGDLFYGLPFTQCDPASTGSVATTLPSGPYPSQELWQGSVDTGTKLRTISVEYEAENLPIGPSFAVNSRLIRRHETFHDDLSGATPRTREVLFSDFDGLGHFRTTTEKASFGVSLDRVLTTTYNPDAGTLLIGVDGKETSSSSFALPDKEDPWILDLSTETKVTQGAATALAKTCYDASTGFLERRWVQAGASRGAADLVTVQLDDDDDGRADRVLSYGGDDQAVPTSGDVCAVALGTPKYTTLHTYAWGALASSTAVDCEGEEILKTVDLAIDDDTGLPAIGRDSAGVATTLSYDALGRLTEENPTNAARTLYTYRLPSTADPSLAPQLTVKTCAVGTSCNELTWRQTTYDGLGRPTFEEIKFPGEGGGTVTSERTKTYNAMGWLLAETMWNDAAHLTTYTGHDRFGRVGFINLPDGKFTKLIYGGDRITTRRVEIATGASGGENPSFTTETRDAFGRLVEVCEGQTGNGAGVCDTNSAVLTKYTYDLADRLTAVCADFRGGSCTQSRAFTYDQRGFLTAETHPEVGPAGNGATFYRYDAAGNVISRELADVSATFPDFSLRYRYDAAGRLIFVDEVTAKSSSGAVLQSRRLKEFAYGRDNAGEDLRKGKLVQAKRYNWVDPVQPIYAPGGALVGKVVDRYVYAGRGGRVSERQTRFQLVTTTNAWNTAFAYDELGNVSQIDYPRCLHYPCAGTDPARAVTFVYERGFLASIPTFATRIGYQADGMLQSIQHANGVKEIVEQDADGLSRPMNIRTLGVLNAQGLPAEWETGDYVYDGAGNVKTIGSGTTLRRFQYDRWNRLVSGQLLDGSVLRTQTVSYDNLGNVTAMTTAGVPRTLTTATSTNRLASNGALYDAAGNLTRMILDTTYEHAFDGLSVMKSLRSQSGLARVFFYDADDERIGQFDCVLVSGACATSPKETWTLRGLDGQVLRTFEKDIVNQGTWIWKEDQIHRGSRHLAFVRPASTGGETRQYLHLDHLGSIRLATDPAGKRIEEKSYAPYGKAFGPAVVSKASFTGHERDLTTATVDLDYMHARSYSPTIGRFLRVDPGKDWSPAAPQSWNRYAYTRGNPVNAVDPDGRAVVKLDNPFIDFERNAAIRGTVSANLRRLAVVGRPLAFIADVALSGYLPAGADELPGPEAFMSPLGAVAAGPSAAVGKGLGKLKAPIHHLMTNKNWRSSLRGGPWSPRFDDLAKKAGMSLDDVANKVAVVGHSGPHPEAYHQAVFDHLTDATKGLSGDDYTSAFKKALDEIRIEAATVGSDLNKLLTKP